MIEATSLNPLGLFGNGGSGITDLDTLLAKINFFARFNWVYLILTWTTIFAVKFGFLSFFRHLVRGLPSFYRYWRVVVGVTVVVYLFSLVDGVIACPHDGLTACAAFPRFPNLYRQPLLCLFNLANFSWIVVSCSVDYAREVGATAIGLDILTDLLSMASSFPLLSQPPVMHAYYASLKYESHC